jgi:uncharacterized protein (TIGR03546 family)
MFSRVIHPVRILVEAIVDPGSSRRIALGFALGMLLGLVPKGNLTAAALAVVVLAVRVNLPAAAASAGLFTWLAAWTDPLAHRVGLTMLGKSWVQPIGAYLYDLPVLPWTALNNSLVLGSLLVGLTLFFPLYYVVSEALDRYRPRLVHMLEEHHALRALALADSLERRKVR